MELALASLNQLSIATFFLFLFISHYFLKKLQHQRKVGTKKQAFSPPGAWPIIGHLHMLPKGKLSHHALATMADKYGPIFRLQLGTRSALVISNREMAKEVLYHNDAAAASRPVFCGMEKFTYDNALFGLAPTSPYWREMRKVVNTHLLSNQRLDMLKTTMFSQVDISLNELHDAAARSSGHVLVETRTWFGELVLNVVLKIIMGKQCIGPNREGCEEEAAKELDETITESFRILDGGLLSDYFPLLGWLGFDGKVKKLEKVAKRSDRIFQHWLEEHKRKRMSCESLDTKENGDFMDSLLSLIGSDKFPTCFHADTIIKSTILSMIAGGAESTIVTLTWAMSLMLNNPHTIEKAQRELDEVVGRERRVNESDINKFVYLQAMIKETLRLYPPATLIGPREFLQDCMVGDYFVTKGTQLIPNAWKIHTDPNIWPDHFHFKPHRFLTTHKDVELKGNNFELLPFGTGRRGCPGTAFALQVLHFTVAGFLLSFNVKLTTSDVIDMSERYGLANEKLTPLHFLVTPRLPSHLYPSTVSSCLMTAM